MEALTDFLNQHAKQVRATAYSKRWWGPRVIEGRAIYTQARTRFQQGIIGTKGLREARNCYYRIIRREKREC